MKRERERPSHAALSSGPVGALLLLLWLLSQFFDQPVRHVLSFFELAAERDDSGFLFAAAGILVLTNAARALLLYEGWFLLAAASAATFRRPFLQRLLPLFAVPLCYQLVVFLDFPSAPHFGIPAILSLVSVLLIQILTRDVSGLGNQVLPLGILLFSFQWLDVIPFLTPWGFGWGELSLTLKQLAVLLGKENVLNGMASVSFLGVFAGALVTTELLASYEKQLAQLRRIRNQERELSRLREAELQARATEEMQRLVHDLKRPLTTVTGLADVLATSLPPGKEAHHVGEILRASTTMNQMISEILDPRVQRPVQMSGLLDYAEQIRPTRSNAIASTQKAPESVDLANMVRLSRALVNLLDNAHRATENHPTPRILLGSALDPERGRVQFFVEDNGSGMETPPRPRRSGWGSTGLGLSFVEEVVREHGGILEYGRSDALGGAAVVVELPLVSFGKSGKETP
jgi:signal transduction histidine kinase